MGNTYGGVAPSNQARKVRARAPQGGGSLSKGNRYVVNTGSKTPLAADMPQAWHGDLPAMPPQWVLDSAADKVISGGYRKRVHKLCPGCNLMLPANKRCTGCWND